MSSVNLRPVRVSDLELLLAWRSNPKIYELLRDQEEPISWKAHLEWFATRSEGRDDFIIEYNGRRVGVVTVTEDEEVGIYIGETSLWGEGVATTALGEIVEQSDDDLIAEIHRENKRSQKLFERCGFVRVGGEEWLQYRYEG